jgi:hypothetical protein
MLLRKITNGIVEKLLTIKKGATLKFETGSTIKTGDGSVIDLTELGSLNGLLATTAEINRACDVSTRIVNCTASTLVISAASHDGKTITLNRAGGIAVTLPAATGSGARYRFVVGTKFTTSGTIKVTGTDTMTGLMLGLDDDGAPANAWTVSGTNDTITLDGTTMGGDIGDLIEIEDVAAAVWQVNGFIKQTGTEATPMSATVP